MKCQALLIIKQIQQIIVFAIEHFLKYKYIHGLGFQRVEKLNQTESIVSKKKSGLSSLLGYVIHHWLIFCSMLYFICEIYHHKDLI
jgi:hypothetical protein